MGVSKMKVVKEGNTPSLRKWKVIVKCSGCGTDRGKGCGAELEVKFKDLVMMHWYGTHFPHYYIAVKCPMCFKFTSVETLDSIWEKFNTEKNRKNSVFSGVDGRI